MSPRKRTKSSFLWNNKLFWMIIISALAVVTSFIKVLVMPQGGSVTYLSLLFVWLVTFMFGRRYGLVFGIVFGFARLGITYLTGEYINTHVMAILLEYPIAHAVFCLGDFIKEPEHAEKNIVDENEMITSEPVRLRAGYLLGVVGMLVCYVVSAELFYPMYRDGFWDNLIYNTIYDTSYLLIEAGITLAVLMIPKVAEALYYIRYVANHRDEDDTLKCF